MKDIFVLKLMQHFEKSNSVFLHIKDGENELTLKKEGAFHSVSPIPVGFPVNPAQNAAALSNAAQNVFTAPMGEAALQTAGQTVESAVAASATTALPNNIQQNTAADAARLLRMRPRMLKKGAPCIKDNLCVFWKR